VILDEGEDIHQKERKKGIEEEKEREMALHWVEAVLPLGIIAGMLCVMGNAQYYIHRAAHGRVCILLHSIQFICSVFLKLKLN